MLRVAFKVNARAVGRINHQQSITTPLYKLNLRLFSTSESESTEGQQPPDSTTDEPVAEAPELDHAAIQAKLETEIKDLKEKVLRSLAEEENVRRIAKRDVDNARAYANSKFATAMLEVADDLERATSVVPADKLAAADCDPSLKSLMEGIEMTDKNLHKIFNQFGISKYGKAGQEFDPNIHDALFRIPSAGPEQPVGTIGQVVKLGYKLKDRVIRAAEVGTYV